MEDFVDSWQAAAAERSPPLDTSIHPDARFRLERLAGASPLYRKTLLKHPDWVPWLEDPAVRDQPYGPGLLAEEWNRTLNDSVSGSDSDWSAALRRFRRRISLRIAYRECNGLGALGSTLQELSSLADFCCRLVLEHALSDLKEKYGEPRRGDGATTAPYSILGLGKLGGSELNFCSDIDLILLFDGRGHCYKGERALPTTNKEFFTRLSQEFVKIMQQRTADGFLYNVDVRLRPEGNAGPLVWPLQAAVDYYFTRGQTWERLMLLRARHIAGTAALSDEFLEMIHTFRYPRYAPASLPADVAAMKRRTEAEVVGHGSMDTNIKNGFGGIREIEFFTQLLQLVEGGRNPFMQTGSTREIIRQLTRYERISEEEGEFLESAYDLLRLLENRLQMWNEQQTHVLPSTQERREALARSLGFPSVDAFEARLKTVRRRVREFYDGIFPGAGGEEETNQWSAFFSGGTIAPAVEAKIESWFPGESEAPEVVRAFFAGSRHRSFAKEEVALFAELVGKFDQILPESARPLETLRRLDSFANAYGARKQFLRMANAHPPAFRALALLFDRSAYFARLLARHPEILEELLGAQTKRRKSAQDLAEEISLGPDRDEFAPWLWLYVRAEQVRITMNQLLGLFDLAETERALSTVACSAISATLQRTGAGDRLAVVALGKLGGEELGIGSDLDVLVLAEDSSDSEAQRQLRSIQKTLTHADPLGPTFDLDLRLRPHGNDGPLLVTPPALQRYHEQSGRAWERQMMTRARPLAGNAELLAQFIQIQEQLAFERGLTLHEWDELASVRDRILREKANSDNPEAYFKSCRGGLIDIEFSVQRAQLIRGRDMPQIRSANTRKSLQALVKTGIVDAPMGAVLTSGYHHLRSLEFHLRRDSNAPESKLPDDPERLRVLAHWMDYAATEHLMTQHQSRIREIAEATASIQQNLRESIES